MLGFFREGEQNEERRELVRRVLNVSLGLVRTADQGSACVRPPRAAPKIRSGDCNAFWRQPESGPEKRYRRSVRG